jgi:hypothetical protein
LRTRPSGSRRRAAAACRPGRAQRRCGSRRPGRGRAPVRSECPGPGGRSERPTAIALWLASWARYRTGLLRLRRVMTGGPGGRAVCVAPAGRMR